MTEIMRGFDPDALRKDFPILARRIGGRPLAYLDNAATTQKPRQVLEAMREFYEQRNANVHRAVHTLSHEATLAYEAAHQRVAEFIGASPEEIIFTRNATEALNLVAYAWGLWELREGDEVLLTVMEHHSNLVPWLALRRLKGISLKFIDVDDRGRLRLEELTRLLSSRTRLVGCIYASNVLGTINPVEEIIAAAHRIGALVLVDGAQAVPHIPVDVRGLDCDFLAASGHKMLGPTGTGFLYAKRELLEEMEPFLYGGDMIETVTLEGATWNRLPWKFEAGTANIAGGIGLAAAVDYLEGLGMEAVYDHERRLLEFAWERLAKVEGIRLYGPAPDEAPRLGIISFNLEGVHPHDLAMVLDSEGIAIRSGHHCAQPLMARLGMEFAARASFYIYNTEEEVERLAAGVEEAKAAFRVRS
ncbi:MAG: cysteine desulfurase [Candidatus Acetothermia bacterium]|jgi:cysteine desulfurase/selenocysteine lyase|nr:cysteine desulfurase [Candidatus Acetothermia bacterium]MDH7504554.1 cysteine desulfurase [Candidatus Acetothermia bacterium]